MILITGATGHIGNVLSRELSARGEYIRTLILPGEDCRSLDGLDIEKFEGDVCNPESLKPAMDGVDVVYHLAGIISISTENESLVERVNVGGTRNIILAAMQNKVRRLVYTSSIHAITRAPHGTTIDESLPFNVETACGVYDRSKARASLSVLEAARQGLDAVVVCPTGVIGPHDFRISEMGALLLEFMKRKVQFWIDGAYDFVDVRDVVQGLTLAAERGRRGEHYILSGEQISMKDILLQVREALGSRAYGIHIPISLAKWAAYLAPAYYRLTHSRPLLTPYSLSTVLANSQISSAKARRELGYTTRPIRESIRESVHWLRLYQQQEIAS